MSAGSFSQLGSFETLSTTDQVFQALYLAVITLELVPGTKVSEAEIAKSLDVSRQPVRDAFYRLSELGFLRIRPQRATTITKISERAVHDARFIRTALEVECMRTAMEKITPAELQKLEDLIDQQEIAMRADDKLRFHDLDDLFHLTICEIAGHANAWRVIRDQKVHMDRVRYLSLYYRAQSAVDDHHSILKCIKDQDVAGAEQQLRVHLSRISDILEQVQKTHAAHFEADGPQG